MHVPDISGSYCTDLKEQFVPSLDELREFGYNAAIPMNSAVTANQVVQDFDGQDEAKVDFKKKK